MEMLYLHNGILIRNFVLVLDPKGTPALFDVANGKLYYNAGSGKFKTNKD